MHKSAFKDYQNVKIDGPYLKKFLKYFFENPGAICIIAKENNEILGYVFGSYYGYFNKLNIKLLPYLASTIVVRPKVLFLKGFFESLFLKFKALFIKTGGTETVKSKFTRENTFSLVGIGVNPEARNKGVGKRLMESFEQEVKKMNKGYKYLRLTVYTTNESAKNLYLKSGWTIDLESSSEKSYIFFKKID